MNFKSKGHQRLGLMLSEIILLGCLFFSCLKDVGEKDPCIGINTSFGSEIFPLITSSCAQIGCHTSAAPFGDFTSYAGIKTKVNDGSFSRRTFEQKNMPIGSTLTSQDLNKLKCWIKNGAQNN